MGRNPGDALGVVEERRDSTGPTRFGCWFSAENVGDLHEASEYLVVADPIVAADEVVAVV